MSKPLTVSASEIGEYVYCQMCWWKRLNGLIRITQQMIDGNHHHHQLSVDINQSKTNQSYLVKVIFIVVLLITILILAKFIFI